MALRRIADFFNVEYNVDPQATDPISITKEEFDGVYAQLADAGVPVVADREPAWRDYAGWRVNYDAPLLAPAILNMGQRQQKKARKEGVCAGGQREIKTMDLCGGLQMKREN
ncbi:MAG: hypothetical protein KBG20_21500, partial [Caldilineaceae bacterium]|nr:hypothetical protein [Caldilineaceae bacterium]MBP8109843.1 hypothetical protein [Caldilineaceae bacterium]MBP8125285.1 hypothetical protein [Caldilineaceae bacterium]MBP9074897.1 hypothetical protein [Caldilineaceae bacterium]